MPRRNDLKKIMIIGSGPIVIGQAGEFDYSGTQAVKALNELGYETVLVNSNPASIMTDRDLASRTYLEPINRKTLEKIILREKPDALLPTMGGQTSLNVSVELAEAGVLERNGIELIGAGLHSIKKAEDRELFKEAVQKLGLQLPAGGFARNMDEAKALVKTTGFPAIIRPAFTLGGEGGSVAYNLEEYKVLAEKGMRASPIGEILVEESVIGWKEFELEVMRDQADNVVIVCSIENMDPMGVHTGDSVTIAPAQTLTDREYQCMRNAAIAIIREIGVDTGGSNIQFAVDPVSGRMAVIEMNPRVSRSSALASKATGFPVAKIAAQLAVGMTLPEITNDITGKTPACFEPALDYVAVKIPRWDFEKFPQADPVLTTQMRSVGETMAIGRTFGEALQKAVRSLETGRCGFEGGTTLSLNNLRNTLKRPTPERLFYLAEAYRAGMSVEESRRLTGIDPWFLAQIENLVHMEEGIRVLGVNTPEDLRRVKREGFSDRRIAQLTGMTEAAVGTERLRNGIRPVYKAVDTCAAEFDSETSCYYSTWESENESKAGGRPRVVILGSGPNRIGQGIEFDYCCVHAVMALKELGYETVMINNNPETVSTDYDTADKLYFEPLTVEDVLAVVELERPEGVIVQFGGQTPLTLARGLEAAGVPIMGTSPEAIDLAEDRGRFGRLIKESSIRLSPWGTAFTFTEAKRAAADIGYPVLVRPSYVLGGRGMEIVYDERELETYITQAAGISPDHPVLIDKFLEDAFEFDVDAVSDGSRTVICGCMQHIEEAGVHSGDSSCVLPPYMLSSEDYTLMETQTCMLAKMLGVRGLMNIQFALYAGDLYVLEVNPRASRTVPFVSKATGVPWAKIGAKVTAGLSLQQAGVTGAVRMTTVAVKTPVFPFMKFPGVQIFLGPEMKSTGEVMGMDTSFGGAFAKAQFAAGHGLPQAGRVFISVNDRDKPAVLPVARQLHELGFSISATSGTHRALKQAGIPAALERKIGEGRPHIADRIINGEIQLVINTPLGRIARSDEFNIGRAAAAHDVPCLTTLSAAWAAVQAIRTLQNGPLGVTALQDTSNGPAGKGGAMMRRTGRAVYVQTHVIPAKKEYGD